MRLLLRCRQNHWLLPADLGLGFRIHLKFQSCQHFMSIQNLWVIQNGGDDCKLARDWCFCNLTALGTMQPMHKKMAKSMSVKQTWESSILPEGSRPFAILQLSRRHWWLRCKQSCALKMNCPKMGASLRHPTKLGPISEPSLREINPHQSQRWDAHWAFILPADPIYSLKGWPFGNSVTHGNRSDIASLRRSKLLRSHIQSLRFQASHCFAVSSAAVPLAVLRHLATADLFRKRWWQCHSWSHCLARNFKLRVLQGIARFSSGHLTLGSMLNLLNQSEPSESPVYSSSKIYIKKSYQRNIFSSFVIDTVDICLYATYMHHACSSGLSTLQLRSTKVWKRCSARVQSWLLLQAFMAWDHG